MILALILFILTYVGLLALSDKRAWVALISAALFVLLGILPVGDVLGAVDFNVLMMIAGTMGIYPVTATPSSRYSSLQSCPYLRKY